MATRLYQQYKSFNWRDFPIPKKYDFENTETKQLITLYHQILQLYIRSRKAAELRQLYRQKYVDEENWDVNHAFEIKQNLEYSQQCEDLLTDIVETISTRRNTQAREFIQQEIQPEEIVVDISDVELPNKKVTIKRRQVDDQDLPLNKRRYWSIYASNLDAPEYLKYSLLEYLMAENNIKHIRTLLKGWDNIYSDQIQKALDDNGRVKNYKRVLLAVFDLEVAKIIPMRIRFTMNHDFFLVMYKKYILNPKLLNEKFKFNPYDLKPLFNDDDYPFPFEENSLFMGYMRDLYIAILLFHHPDSKHFDEWRFVNNAHYFDNFEMIFDRYINENLSVKNILNKINEKSDSPERITVITDPEPTYNENQKSKFNFNREFIDEIENKYPKLVFANLTREKLFRILFSEGISIAKINLKYEPFNDFVVSEMTNTIPIYDRGFYEPLTDVPTDVDGIFELDRFTVLKIMKTKYNYQIKPKDLLSTGRRYYTPDVPYDLEMIKTSFDDYWLTVSQMKIRHNLINKYEEIMTEVPIKPKIDYRTNFVADTAAMMMAWRKINPLFKTDDELNDTVLVDWLRKTRKSLAENKTALKTKFNLTDQQLDKALMLTSLIISGKFFSQQTMFYQEMTIDTFNRKNTAYNNISVLRFFIENSKIIGPFIIGLAKSKFY